MEFNNIADLQAAIGQDLPPSEWMTVTQEMINAFADATHDHQWIHIDVEKAKAHSPFKTPIAHGFLSLSLLSHLIGSVVHVKSAKMGINYGLNKVRFTSPVPVNGRVRLNNLKLIKTDPYGDNGARNVWACIIELEGSEKPACIAEFVSLIFE